MTHSQNSQPSGQRVPPGEWYQCGDEVLIDMGDRAHLIATVADWSEDTEPYARLIAAAPDLLEALILLEREMVESGNAGSEDYGWKPAIEKTRAALSKAQGSTK